MEVLKHIILIKINNSKKISNNLRFKIINYQIKILQQFY